MSTSNQGSGPQNLRTPPPATRQPLSPGHPAPQPPAPRDAAPRLLSPPPPNPRPLPAERLSPELTAQRLSHEPLNPQPRKSQLLEPPPPMLERFQIDLLGPAEEGVESTARWLRAGLWDSHAEELRNCEVLSNSVGNLSLHLPKALMSDIVSSFANQIRAAEGHGAPGSEHPQHDTKAEVQSDLEPHLEKGAFSRALLPPPDSDMASLTTGPEGLRSMEHGFATARQLNPVPMASYHMAVLLFVDISGFTKLSTVLEVESFSKAINAYFEIIVNEINRHGGDIVKFAGDGLFAAWSEPDSTDLAKVEKQDLEGPSLEGHEIEQHQGLQYTVMRAAKCGARIVATCSDYLVPLVRLRGSSTATESAVLNLHCGLGVGNAVFLKVGDNDKKRTSLVLGEIVEQVTKAAGMAMEGELAASPEALAQLAECCHLPLGQLDIEPFEMSSSISEPLVIAKKGNVRFVPKVVRQKSSLKQINVDTDHLNPLQELLGLSSCNSRALESLWHEVSLYVHPVVRQDEREQLDSLLPGGVNECVESLPANFPDAELRSVFTMFIKPDISITVSGDSMTDKEVFQLINNVMNVTTAELHPHGGQLINYLLDDKGLVLVAAFGLRGSSSANMVADKALPACMSIANALEAQLGIRSKIGATVGMAYCGVVGGQNRCEYSVLGPSVNLACRLMCSEENAGLLVDDAVRKQASSHHNFKSLARIEAKGYDRKVPIFEPLSPDSKNWRSADVFVGRENELAELIDAAKSVFLGSIPGSGMVIVSAEKGLGKSSLVHHAVSNIRRLCTSEKQEITLYSHVCQEQQHLVPFSAVKKIFLENLLLQDANDRLSGSRPLHSPLHSVLPEVKGRRPRRRSSTQDGVGRLPRRDRAGSEDSDISVFSAEAFAIRQRRQSKTSSIGVSPLNSRCSSVQTISSRSKFSSVGLTANSISYSTGSSQASRSRCRKLIRLCKEMGRPASQARALGTRFLGLDDRHFDEESENSGNLDSQHTEHSNQSNQCVDEIIDFFVSSFLKCKPAQCILAVDDVQWIDPVSWRFLKALHQRGRGILLMLTSWPLEKSHIAMSSTVAESLNAHAKEWSKSEDAVPDSCQQTELMQTLNEDQNVVRVIKLSPLTASSMRELAAKTLGCAEKDVNQDLCDYLLQQTQGLPFFAGEILKVMKRENWRARSGKSEAEKLSRRRSTYKSVCTPSSFTGIDRMLLDKLDGLSNRVRKSLQLCALLGVECSVSELREVEPFFSNYLDIKSWKLFMECLQTAVQENVLVQVWTGGRSEESDHNTLEVDDVIPEESSDGARLSSADVPSLKELHSLSSDEDQQMLRRTSSNGSEEEDPGNQFSFRFSHEIWRDVVLGTMLESQKREMHRSIAQVLEAKYHLGEEEGEEGHSVCPTEVSSMFVLFGHWRDSGDTSKAVSLALSIGGKFEQWGLFKSALALYEEALAMFKCLDEGTCSETTGGVDDRILVTLNTDEVEKLVRLQTRAAVNLQDLEDLEGAASMFRNAYDVLRQVPVAAMIEDYDILISNLAAMFCDFEDDNESQDHQNFQGRNPGSSTVGVVDAGKSEEPWSLWGRWGFFAEEQDDEWHFPLSVSLLV